MDAVERLGLGIPIILLSAIWGAFGLVLKVFELLNATRNQVLLMKADEEYDLGWSALVWNDWLWLWMGTCGFLVTITGILLYMPKFFSGVKEIDVSLQRKTRILCYTVAALPGFSALGFFIGGALDLIQMLN